MNSRIIAYERNRQMRAAAAAINNEPLPLSAERLVPIERSLEAAMTRFRNRAPPLGPHYMGQDLSPRSRPGVPRIGRDNEAQDQMSTIPRDDDFSRTLPLPVPTPPPASWSPENAEGTDRSIRTGPPSGRRWNATDREITSDSLRRSALERHRPPPSPFVPAPESPSQSAPSHTLPDLTPEFAPARQYSSETARLRHEPVRSSSFSNTMWAYEVIRPRLQFIVT
jgi:hypothetical protein